jgi:nucleotidyltransferase substrate binding protein (TIGR01987 family)
MEIIVRYQAMQRALQTFEIGLVRFEKNEGLDAEDIILKRDGVIQRFEYCIDTFWKLLKIYFEFYNKFVVEVAAPRTILKLAFNYGLILEEEYKILLDAVTDRNLTSHTYNEKIAVQIQSRTPLYYATLKKVVDRMNVSE